MERDLTSAWLWLAVYLLIIGGIAAYTVHWRNQRLADDDENAKDRESWREWREAAAKQDGTTGPVQRSIPKSSEPPMLIMLRDNFGVILGAALVFSGIIIGFLMIVLRGMLRQSLDRQHAESAAVDGHDAA